VAHARDRPRELQLFADAFPDGIVGADATGAVTVLNTQAAKMLEVPRPKSLGRSLEDVLRLRDQEGRSWVEVNRPYQSLTIRTGVPEQSWVLPNGQEVLVTARVLWNGRRDQVSGVAISLRSGRGRARLDRERSDLVATVAHELRSPLTGVKGFVQAMLSRWDRLNDEQKILMLNTVNADADRLSRLIAELLDVARIDTGRLSLYPRPSPVPRLVERIVESVRAATSRPIEMTLAADLPEAWVDPDKFTQVVTNLLENAVRHGEGVVRVSGVHLPDRKLVALTVEDDGDGIAEEIRARVFTKFWKHGARAGSGLGMYIVGGLVRAHGGDVEIGTSAGGGARITTTWPVGPPPEQ
jgi:signal transduction histidine kinase